METLINPNILSIDLGTSGPKVGLVSSRGEVLACEFEPTPLTLLPNGGAEQNPQDWWNAIVKATRRLLKARLVPVESIKGLSCTSQWSGTVPVDRSGNPLMNAIIWMDSRGAPYVEEITGGFPEIEGYNILKLLNWIRLTGGVPTKGGKDPIAHILYLKYEQPEIYRQAYKFLEPKDYINLRLTGKYAAGVDSICMHWVTDNRDINRIKYDDGLLQIADLDREKLPDLMRSTDILGPLSPQSAEELGLSGQVKVVIGTPDIHSAAIGSGAVRDFEAHVYIGTSSWLSCHMPYKKTDLFHNMASVPSGIPGKYMLLDEQEIAGGCLTYLRDSLLFPQDSLSGGSVPEDYFDRLNQAAINAPAGSGKLIFTPWLYGERTPVDDSLIRGGFFNQSLQTTRQHMVRAVFEGVAYNTRWLLQYVEKFIGRPVDNIHLVGGGARSNLWCQIYADVLNRSIRQIRSPVQVNLRGAAYLALVALGCMKFEEISGVVDVENTYHPDPANRAIYDELFTEYVNIYQKLRPIYARLNRQPKITTRGQK